MGLKAADKGSFGQTLVNVNATRPLRNPDGSGCIYIMDYMHLIEIPRDKFILGKVPRLHPLGVREQRGQEVDEERISVEVDLDEAPGLGEVLVLVAAFLEPDNALKWTETLKI